MEQAAIVAVVRDLMFASKIRGAGSEVRIVREPGRLAGVEGVGRVLVDLNLAGAIEATGEYLREHPGVEVVGFVSHTDAVTIGRAREAGIQRVMARSAFVEALPELVNG